MDFSHTIYLKVSKPLVKCMVRLGITGNQVTIFNMFLTVIGGCYYFSRGTWKGYWIAFGIMAVSVVLDYLDGDIAKATKAVSKLGVWLDSFGDVIIQNAIMGAIALGCLTQGLKPVVVIIFFVANAALNVVSIKYNYTFGFTSYKGNSLFRELMDNKNTWFNNIMKNMIDPTASVLGLICWTVRYWILIGIFFNVMPFMFVVMAINHMFRALFMYWLYALYLTGSQKLYVLQVLAVLDPERKEYYSCRTKQ